MSILAISTLSAYNQIWHHQRISQRPVKCFLVHWLSRLNQVRQPLGTFRGLKLLQALILQLHTLAVQNKGDGLQLVLFQMLHCLLTMVL